MSCAIDLHTHSNYSDGTLSPSALIDLAADNGLTALSLTDHDTIDGLTEAMSQGTEREITVVSGIEISAQQGETSLHILGYGFDANDGGLRDMVRWLQVARQERNREILDKLQTMGMEIKNSELVREGGKLTGRPHIANLLKKKGYVASIDEAFRRYLRDGGPAFVPGRKLQAAKALETINLAGGLTALAHPPKIDKTLRKLPRLLDSLASHGLAGLEAYYPGHTPTIVKKLEKMAKSYNLICTGGSDFHGLYGHGDHLAGGSKSWWIPDHVWPAFLKRLSKVGHLKELASH